jgi:hypothetical protein
LFHHPVAGSLASYGQPVELTRQTHGEVANVDHLLHLTLAFADRLAALDGDEAGKIGLVLAQSIAKKADEFASAGGGDGAPCKEGALSAVKGGIDFG